MFNMRRCLALLVCTLLILASACIGVSAKSVEAWEGGRSRPDGAARRLIGLMRDHRDFAQNMGIVTR